jgi:hypothetical protein
MPSTCSIAKTTRTQAPSMSIATATLSFRKYCSRVLAIFLYRIDVILSQHILTHNIFDPHHTHTHTGTVPSNPGTPPPPPPPPAILTQRSFKQITTLLTRPPFLPI